jgi:N-methylhydantoinase A/oxoprolinase/acetone carboxylase beta subunit
MRDVYFENSGWHKVPVHLRESLPTGRKLTGACVVEEPIATTLIPADFNGTIDEFKNIIIKAEIEHAE